MDFRKYFYGFLLCFGTVTSGLCAMGGQQPQQPQQASVSPAVSAAAKNAAQAEALYQQAVAAEGRGSCDEAWKLYLRAAQKDSKAACAVVGHSYLYGNASMCNQNLDLANNYLQIAAALGDDGAAVDLVALQEMRAQREAEAQKAAKAEQASMGWGDESDQEDDDKKDAEARDDGYPKLLTAVQAQHMQEYFDEMLGDGPFDWSLASTHEAEEKPELTGSLASFASTSAKSTTSSAPVLQERSQAQQLEHKHARPDDEEKEDEGMAQARVKRNKPETNGTVTDGTTTTEQQAQKASRDADTLTETDQDKAAREKAAKERDRAAINASKIEEPTSSKTAKTKKIAKDDSDSEDDIPLGQLIAKPTTAADVSEEKMQNDDSAKNTASVSSRGRGGSAVAARGRGRGRGSMHRRPVRVNVPTVAAATGQSTTDGINKQVVRINRWLVGVLNKYIAIANVRVTSDVARASGDKKNAGRKAKAVRFDSSDEKKEAAMVASGVATFLDTHTQADIPGELLTMMATYAGIADDVMQDTKIVVTFLLSTNKFRSNAQELLETTDNFDIDEDKTILHMCKKNEKPPQKRNHRGRAASQRSGLRSRKTPLEALKSVLKADGVSFNTGLYDAIKRGDLVDFKNVLRSDETMMYGLMDNDFDSSMYDCLIQGNEYSPLEVALHSLETSMQQLKALQRVKKAQHGLYGFGAEQSAQELDQKMAQVQQVIRNQQAMLTTIVSYYDMPMLNKFLVYCAKRGEDFWERNQPRRVSPRCLGITFPFLVEAGLIITNDRYKEKKSDYGVVLLYLVFEALADAELQKDTAMRQALFAYLDAHAGEIDLNSGSDRDHDAPLKMLLSTLSAACYGDRPIIGRITSAMFNNVIFAAMRRGATMMNSSDPVELLYFLISHYEIVEDLAAVIKTLVANQWVDINAQCHGYGRINRAANTALIGVLDINDNQQRVTLFKVLVGCGADMKIANQYGCTPLTYCGHEKEYYNQNANSNPIMYSAAKVGDVELIKILLAAGVNPTEFFVNGKTAAMVAEESGHKEAAAILAAAAEEVLKKSAQASSSATASAQSTDVKQAQHQQVQPIPPVMPMAQQQQMVQRPQQPSMLSATQMAAIYNSLAVASHRTVQQQAQPHVQQQQEHKQAAGVLTVRVDSAGLHYLRDGQPVAESDLTTGERQQLDIVLRGRGVSVHQQPAASEREFAPSWETLLLEQQRVAAQAQAQQQDQQQTAALAEEQEDDQQDQQQHGGSSQQAPEDDHMDTHEKS